MACARMHRRRSPTQAKPRRLLRRASIALLIVAALLLAPAYASAIQGGAVVPSPNPYPFVGWLDQPDLRCTVELIQQDWALTAKHCVMNEEQTGFIDQSKVTLIFGASHTDAHFVPEGTRATVTEIRPYPSGHIDLALIHIDPPPGITPISIAAPSQSGLVRKKPLTTVGWGVLGRNQSSPASRELRYATMKLADLTSSSHSILGGLDHVMKLLAAGPKNGTTAAGDSGGALLATSPTGVPILIGVTQGGGHCLIEKLTRSKYCASYATKLWVSPINEWIRGTLSNDSSAAVDLQGQIAAGGDVAYEHACAVTASGGVACWGSDAFGQLGNGATSGNGGNFDSALPVAVVGLGGAEAVSVGGRHSCALISDGRVACWGSAGEPDDALLGDGSGKSSLVPVIVAGLTDATNIDAGAFSTCALRRAGTVLCWGSGFSGGLGNGNARGSPIPVAVSGLTGVAKISVGDSFACALKLTGAVVCWGAGANGRLGTGTAAQDHPHPAAVVGIKDAISVSAGGSHACAAESNGAVFCWGLNSAGQLGTGTIADADAPVRVKGLGLATSVSAGARHSCAILRDRSVACWGEITWDDHLVDRSVTTPRSIAGLAQITTLSAGDGFTCASTKAGSGYCFGRNAWGQLGNGTHLANLSPQLVSGL
jgi:alpha-tubulin suppressor-like RCC1 family protein